MSINIPTAYKTIVNIPFGKLKEHVGWCEDNLVGDWKYTENSAYGEMNNSWIFLFELERDYVAYTLWMK
jgi:hypothetical protein